MIRMADAGSITINNQELSALLKQGVAIVDIRTELEWRQTGLIAAHEATQRAALFSRKEAQ